MLTKKYILLIIGALFVLIGALTYLTFYKGTLKVSTDYGNAAYYLNDKKINYQESYTLTPGAYELRVEVEDRESKTFQFALKPFKETFIQVSGLQPNYLYLDESVEINPANRIAIIKYLPLEPNFGTVDYDEKLDKFTVTLKVGFTKNDALNWFYRAGVKENEETIIWK